MNAASEEANGRLGPRSWNSFLENASIILKKVEKEERLGRTTALQGRPSN